MYGGMPAIEADQDAFFAGLDETYPQDVDWQVVTRLCRLRRQPELRGIRAELPGDVRCDRRLRPKLRSTEGLDVDAEIETFTEQLQEIYDRAE